MDEEDGFYCDDCCDWHESIEDCPETLHDCPKCKAECSVQIFGGPAPDDTPEAHCWKCGWTEATP